MTSKVALQNVPETMLWTLHNRAGEARKEKGIIRDDKCLEIYDTIDYDYERSFGRAEPSHAVRSVVFDLFVRSFLEEHANGVIVNLGEGLETQRFRIESDDGVDWFCVDVPESIEVRERFIVPDARHHHVAKSALDHSWFDRIPEGRPLFVTAQGLLMYFEQKDVEELIRGMSKRWPGMWLMFDHIPLWLSRKTLSRKGLMLTPNYRAPRMPWGIRPSQMRGFLSNCAGRIEQFENPIREWVRHYPPGFRRMIMSSILALPLLRDSAPGVAKLRLMG